MDVKSGHCWRCEKVLPQGTVHCSICPTAVYCSRSCRDKDEVRHGSVECKMFGPKTCSKCGKTAEKMSECARCSNAWYCNKECQLHDWKAHKAVCNQVKASIQSVAETLQMKHSLRDDRKQDFPYYIGNIMAKDLLQLDNNELTGGMEGVLGKDYHILSSGCGNLRNTVLTTGSLPSGYQGTLHITLNDNDPFVMARNVLFLFMLVRFADADHIASSLTTIWYSLHISEREYNLIETSLDELIQMTAQQLNDATKGLVSVTDEDLKYLHQVWEGWQSLECQRNKGTSINLRKQRSSLFERNNVMEGLSLYLAELSQKEKKRMEEWLDHALFLPTETKQQHLPFDNPTLTGREPCLGTAFDISSLDDFKFVYCINTDGFPFTEWDCLKVRENTPTSSSSPMVMYHNYVTNLLQKVKSLILQGRLLIHISLANCLDFPRYHQDLQMPKYDRIFTSNIADYLGFARLLQTFKPLLNDSNPFSAIVTETMNWFKFIPAANIKYLQGTPEFQKCLLAYFSDTKKMVPGCNNVREYFNNTHYFLQYLRADIMAGGLGIEDLKNIPPFIAVKEYYGMQMRDFRKGLNKLVPFQYRVNARDLTMMNGWDRAVEWCLPQSDG